MKTNKQTCGCGGELKYEGDFGAPFHGQSWKCARCGKAYWKCGDGFTAMSDVNPEDMELDPSDVI